MAAAERALAEDDRETCISRAYYALYHLAILLLEVRASVERRRWDHERPE